MRHPNYYTDDFNGQPVYRCCMCKVDGFVEQRVKTHALTQHGSMILPETHLPLRDWATNLGKPFSDLKVALCLLTWNTREASSLAAKAMVDECNRLTSFGAHVRTFWCDNGSTDGTVEALRRILLGRHCVINPTNLGQSKGRNLLLELAQDHDSDYVLLVDGDIEIIPYSTQAMIRVLQARPYLGCVGFHSNNCTHIENDPELALECRAITEDMLFQYPVIAWTQYGMFTREVLAHGVRFDETGPFAGAGWGLEDDDFGFQILDAGLGIAHARHFRYMHRRRNSSLISLDAAKAAETFELRKNHLQYKWKYNKHPAIINRLDKLGQQSMPPRPVL